MAELSGPLTTARPRRTIAAARLARGEAQLLLRIQNPRLLRFWHAAWQRVPRHVRGYLETFIEEVIEREHLERDTSYEKCEYRVGVGVDEQVEGINVLLAG